MLDLMPMSDEMLDTIATQLKDRKLTVVAAETGLSYSAVYNFVTARTREKVSYHVVQQLNNYLLRNAHGGSNKNTTIHDVGRN